MPSYHGTLAAVRCLGERGVPVVIASSTRATAATWSRYARERTACPDVSRGPTQLINWLEAAGRERPGMVLYPTSDEWAWTLSYAASRLSRYFAMYSPSIRTLHTLLDKSALHAACTQLSIPTPRTYLPRSADEAAALVSRHGPLLLKPRSQAFYDGPGKGAVLAEPSAAASVFRQYEKAKYPALLLEHGPDLGKPLLQEYLAGGAEETYSVSGFIDRDGRVLARLGSMKTRQTPPRVGVGLEFESAPVQAAALAAVEKLCRHVGYHGVFEVEFVPRDGVPLLVDFNPRYFGQMGFDVARGHCLPWLVQLCATGHEDEARALVLDVPADAPSGFVNRVGLGFELLTSLGQPERALAVAASLGRASQRRSADATWSPSDPGPSLAAAASLARWAVCHPRTMLRLVTRGHR
jgi:D-aspartate ligase